MAVAPAQLPPVTARSYMRGLCSSGSAHVGTAGARPRRHLHFEVYQVGVGIDPVPVLRLRGVYA